MVIGLPPRPDRGGYPWGFSQGEAPVIAEGCQLAHYGDDDTSVISLKVTGNIDIASVIASVKVITNDCPLLLS